MRLKKDRTAENGWQPSKKPGGGGVGRGAAPSTCKHNARMMGSCDLNPPPPFANTMLAGLVRKS